MKMSTLFLLCAIALVPWVAHGTMVSNIAANRYVCSVAKVATVVLSFLASQTPVSSLTVNTDAALRIELPFAPQL